MSTPQGFGKEWMKVTLYPVKMSLSHKFTWPCIELTSQAVTLVAPARAAIIANSPVPVPISKTCGSFPAAFSWAMALSRAR